MDKKILSTLTGGTLGAAGIVGLALNAGFTTNQLFVIFIVALVLTAFGAPLGELFKDKAKSESPTDEK